MKTCSVLNSPYVHFKFKKYEIAGMGIYGLNRNNRNSFYISLSSADLLIYCYIRKFFTILYFIRVCTLKCTSGVSISFVIFLSLTQASILFHLPLPPPPNSKTRKTTTSRIAYPRTNIN